MESRKVLIACSAPLSRRDGTSVRALRAFKALQHEFQTGVLTMGNRGPDAQVDLPKDTMVIRPWKEILWPVYLAKFLVMNRFDVVVSENDWRWLPILVLLARLRRYKIAFEAHGILSTEMEEMATGRGSSRLYRLRERFLIPRCDLVIALSKDIEGFYKKRAKKVEIVRVFVDLPKSASASREGQSPTMKTVGLIGPFDASRNISTLEFLEENIDRFPPSIQFVVIGKCGNRIEHPNIRYTGFLETAQDYDRTLSSLDAVLVVERIATSGPLNKILEPMGHGVPVFTNPKGLVGLDFAENGQNIFVAENEELPGLVARTIVDGGLMRRVGEHAREMVEKHYNYEIESKKLVSAISGLMPGNS